MHTDRPGAFESEILFDVLAEAAETLHRPGAVKPKLAWAVRAIRSTTGARAVAYVEGGGRPRVRAAAGAPITRLQSAVEGAVAALVRRVRSSERPSQELALQHADGTDTAAVAVPVPRASGGLHGVLLLLAERDDPLDALAWVGEGIGFHLGVAVDNTATIAQLAELEAAQREVVTQLQEAVRPVVPDLPGTDLGVRYLPADPGAPTGGDLYDWHVLRDGDLHAAVVDVTGKGIQATKHALAVTHALRLLVLEDCPMEDLVARADHVLAESTPELAATVMVARYEPTTGRLRLAGGGQPPALHVSPDGSVDLVDAPGLPIGFPDAGSFEVIELTLHRDESLVMYTDGLIETTPDVLDGLEHLGEAASQVSTYPARFLARSLVDRALAGATRRDDALALTLRHHLAESPRRATLGPFRYRFSPSTAAVPLARHLLADWLGYQPVDDAYHDDLLFVATELCTNGIRASSGAPQSVELRAAIDEDAVRIEVEDDGRGFDHDPVGEEPAPDVENGRGLFLVRALTDEVSVDRLDGCTVASCVLRAAVATDGGAEEEPRD